MKRIIILVLALFAIGHYASAEPKQYDGVWFLGFNMKSPLFGGESGKVVRQAVAMAVDRDKIAKKIVGDETVPVNIIPPGMEGYSSLEAYPHDYKQAKQMMRTAGYPLNDKRIKGIALLLTDGEKTRQIVNEIKMDLINLGFDIQTTMIKYSDTDKWQKALASGKYDIFVMGYKAGGVGQIYVGDKSTNLFHTFNCFNVSSNEADIVYFNTYNEAVKAGFTPDSVCAPKPEPVPGTLDLVKPLFYSDGNANMMKFNNKRVDILLEELTRLDPAFRASREDRFEELSRIVWEEVPVVPLFYITRL